MKGKVIKYFPDKGFGFLKLEDGHDCYFHKSKIDGEVEHIYSGDVAEVEFRESRKKPGSFEAVSLEILQKSEKHIIYPENKQREVVDRGVVSVSKQDENFGFIQTHKSGQVYFSLKTEMIGCDFPEIGEKVLMTIIPSEVKFRSYQARTIRRLSNLKLENFIPEGDSLIDDRNFKIIIYLLTQNDRDALITIDPVVLIEFFNCLALEQKVNLFKKWLTGDFDFFDQRYLDETISTLNAYDQLRAISRSQNIEYEKAFDQLSEEIKYQLLNNALVGKTTYFNKNYLRSKFPELSFSSLIKFLNREKSEVKNELYLEYIEQFPPNEYSDSELKVLIYALDTLYDSEAERNKNLFSAIFNNLPNSQKSLFVDALANRCIQIYDRAFLLADIKRFTHQERFMIARRVDEQTASTILDGIIEEFLEDKSSISKQTIVQLLEDINYSIPGYPTAILCNQVFEFISPEDRFNLWCDNLIGEFDEKFVLNMADLSDSYSFLKVIRRSDETFAYKFAQQAIHKYNDIIDIELYKEISFTLKQIKDYFVSPNFEGDLSKYIMQTIYNKSSDMIRVSMFLDQLVDKVELKVILANISLFNTKNCIRAIRGMEEADQYEFLQHIIKSKFHDMTVDVLQSIVEIFAVGSTEPHLIEYTGRNINIYVPDERLSELIITHHYYHYNSNDEFFTILVNYLNHRGIQVEPKPLAILILNRLLFHTKDVSASMKSLINPSYNFNDLLSTTNYLLFEGLCRFKSGKYKGCTVYEILLLDSSYIYTRKWKKQSLLDNNSRLVTNSYSVISDVAMKVLNFIISSIIPVLKQTTFINEKDISYIGEIVPTLKEIQNQLTRIKLAETVIIPELIDSVCNYLNNYLTTVSQTIEYSNDIYQLVQYDANVGHLIESLQEFEINDNLSNISSIASTFKVKITELINQEFKEKFKANCKDLRSFVDYLGLLRGLQRDNKFESRIKVEDIQEWFFNISHELIESELMSFKVVKNYFDWLKMRKELKKVKSLLSGIPNIDQCCHYVVELESLRDQILENFLLHSSFEIKNDSRYSIALELFDELNQNCDKLRAKKIIEIIYKKSADEYRLRFWLYDQIDIFDFERYAANYFTLTKEERRIFNAKARLILREKLDTKLLKKLTPWKLLDSDDDRLIFSASWRTIWFSNNFIRFCMDEGEFSEVYKWSFSSRDFNSLSEYFSGKRLPDLTVYCRNGVVEEVEGLDELEMIIKKIFFLKEIEKNPEYIIKDEGENRVPRNILLRNECIRILGNLTKEGTKVFRAYERVYTQKMDRQIATDFDTSYLFCIELSHVEIAIVWESVEFEKSKATYIFKCHYDKLRTTLDRIIMFINTTIHVRSSLLQSEEDQQNLGFIGRIEHENFNLESWISKLIAYLPEREWDIAKQLELSSTGVK
jgi:cold shock CspA family protein